MCERLDARSPHRFVVGAHKSTKPKNPSNQTHIVIFRMVASTIIQSHWQQPISTACHNSTQENNRNMKQESSNDLPTMPNGINSGAGVLYMAVCRTSRQVILCARKQNPRSIRKASVWWYPADQAYPGMLGL